MATAAVLGAGSWGTALAIQLARNGHQIKIWDHDVELITSLRVERRNLRYLPDHPFPDSIFVEQDLTATVNETDFILIVVPSHAMRSVCERLTQQGQSISSKFIWATKGFEKQTKLMMHQVIAEILGNKIQTAVLSGPSFAKEVADNLPTAVTLASQDIAYAKELAGYFHSDNFRIYISNDVVGVELGGGVKNVLAIAAGIVDGLGFGANARAALITRGLAEMMRLGQALQVQSKTLMGLAGAGDVVLTCTDNQSRNRMLGFALSRGKTTQQYMDELGQTVEGFHAAQTVYEIAKQNRIEMPICEQVWHVVNGSVGVKEAVSELLGRKMKEEFV